MGRGYIIRETCNGRTREIKTSVKDYRQGWIIVAKTWKTESSARAWITRRIKQLGENANQYKFEIKEHW